VRPELMNASGADDGHPAPAAPGGGAAAPDVAALAGFVEHLGVAPAPFGSAAREQVNAARLAIRRVIKQYDVLPGSLFETVVRAGVHERDPSLCGTLFIIPAIDSYGFQRVMTALLGYLRDGTDREKAGAARAWYWAGGLDTRRAEPDSLADLRAAWREALLREFVSNADLSVRRQAMSMLSLRVERYPAHLLPLVAEAARIGRAHPDESIRRATHGAIWAL
jgi:hypothetical protein